jgi:hypothetical protein
MKQGNDFPGLTGKEIERAFRELTAKFIRSDYHSTYIDRRLGRKGFLEVTGDRYRFRAPLMATADIGSLTALHDELIGSLKSAFEQRQLVIQKLEKACSLPLDRIDERHALIDVYLSQFAGNRGEMFEVVSFAVLREYFRTFGFDLQRFSTTHANDGGMDFVAGNAIYQVTTDESIQKLRKDLAKSPGTKRVLVRPSATMEVIKLCEAEVLETIELKDLLQHFIAWLLGRDTRANHPVHLQQVLKIALEEFRRENKAESA